MTAAEAHGAYRDTRFFASLDGLRAICIFMVIWHHSTLLYAVDEVAPFFVRRGFTGVDFFFVLSGFLITTLLLREEDAKGRFSLRGFYRRRILRIVPVYFLVVTLVGGWFVLVKGETQYAPLWPYYYAFLSNFLLGDIPTLAPTWSLSVEEQYYLFWPLALLLLPARAGVRITLLLALIGYAFLLGLGLLPRPGAIETDHARIFFAIGSYAPILIGSLTAIVLHGPRGFAMLWPLVGHRWFPALGFLVLLGLWQWLPERLAGWPNFLMHPLMALIVASLVVRDDHVMRAPLTFRPVARIGAISYGLYLWHLIGLHIATEITGALGFAPGLGTDVILTLLYVAISIAIAELSFRFFEAHFLRLKTPRARRPRPTVARRTGPPGDQAG